MVADDSHIVKDPVCGKDVDTLRARAVGIFGGVTYYFCSAECKAKFVDPRKEARPADQPAWDPKDRPERQRRSTMENWKVLADAAEPSRGFAGESGVRYAKTLKKRPEPEPEPKEQQEPKKATTSPSIEEEVAVSRGSGRVWVVVFLLFAAAGAALFFAFKR
jgi:YHS domain-containing protein